MDKIRISYITETSKKTGNPYEAIKITIGEWEKLIFMNNKFERDYIKKMLSNEEK